MSNLFREVKVQGWTLHLPALVRTAKWTVLALDLPALLKLHMNKVYSCLKGVNACSSMFIRNVYTSDNFYAYDTMPKDMAFPVYEGQSWEDMYDWQSAPHNAGQVVLQASKNVNAAPKAVSEKAKPKPVLKSKSTPTLPGSKALIDGASVGTREVAVAPANTAIPLQPDPIMEMNHMIGVSGEIQGGVLWSADSSSIVFASSSTLVVMGVETHQQRFLLGHTAPISHLTLCGDKNFMASTQEGKNPVVRVWAMPSGRCVAVLQGHGRDMEAITMSHDGSMIAGVGKDNHGRTLIVVWDVKALHTKSGSADVGAHPDVILARSTTEASVKHIVFSPIEQGRLVSCGNNDIRFWRIKNKKLSSISVKLPTDQPAETFTGLAFEAAYTTPDLATRRFYAATESGQVYQLQYHNRELTCIYKLHNGPITSLCVNDVVCVTGSGDKFLRVWPLDFKEFYLEAEHECEVTSVDISPDGYRVAMGSVRGSLGVLDMSTHKYSTVMRSHRDIISDVDLDRNKTEFATVGGDGTIRVWDIDSHDQLYEFDASGEQTLCVAYHPSPDMPIIACGFENGYVRVFDVPNTRALHEYRPHQGAVLNMVYSPDGKRLFTVGSDGHIFVYDAARGYRPVKMLVGLAPSDAASLRVSPDAKWLASIVPDGTIIVFDANTLEEAYKIPAPTHGKKSAHFVTLHITNDSKSILASTSGKLVEAFDLETGASLRNTIGPLPAIGTAVTTSPNDRYLVVGCEDSILRVFGRFGNKEKQILATASQSFVGHSKAPTKVCFSSNGQQLISIGQDSAVYMWSFFADAADSLTKNPATGEALFDNEEEQVLPLEEMYPISASPSVEGASGEIDIDIYSVSPEGLAGGGLSQRFRAPMNMAAEQVFDPQLRKPLAVVDANGIAFIDDEEDEEEAPIEPMEPVVLPRKHYQTPDYQLGAATQRFLAPEGLAGMSLDWAIGVDSNAHDHMVWSNKSAMLAYSSGCHLILDDLRTERQTVLAAPGLISTLAMSDDGATIASGAGIAEPGEPAVVLWDLESGSVKVALYWENQSDERDYASRGTQSVKFSADDSYVAALSCYPGTAVHVWNSATGDLVGHSTGNGQPHHCLRWHSQATQEFVTGGKNELTFWFCDLNDTVAGLECIRYESIQLPQLQAGCDINCIDFSSNPALESQLLYAGCTNGTVSVWDAVERTCQLCFHADASDSIENIWCHGLSQSIVTGSAGGMLRRWSHSLDDARAGLTGEMHVEGSITGLSFESEMAEGVVATDAGALWYVNWSTEEEALVLLKSSHVGAVTSVKASPHDTVFGTCGVDGSFRMWSLEGAKDEVFKFEAAGEAKCTCLAFSPTERIVAVGFEDGSVRVFDISESKLESALLWHPSEAPITSIGFVAQGSVLTVGSSDGAVTMGWLGEGGTAVLSSSVDLLQHRNSTVMGIEASPRRPDTFAVCSEDQCVSVWNCDPKARQSKIIDFFETNDRYPANPVAEEENSVAASTSAMSIAFSVSEENILLFAGQSTRKAIVFYDFVAQNYVKSVNVEHYVLSLSVSLDGAFIAAGTPDHLVKLIDYYEDNFQDFEGHSSAVHSVAFEPHQHRLLTCGQGSTLIWNTV